MKQRNRKPRHRERIETVADAWKTAVTLIIPGIAVEPAFLSTAGLDYWPIWITPGH
jgi:hypothetical protein